MRDLLPPNLHRVWEVTVIQRQRSFPSELKIETSNFLLLFVLIHTAKNGEVVIVSRDGFGNGLLVVAHRLSRCQNQANGNIPNPLNRKTVNKI